MGKLRESQNYSLFTLLEFNRDVEKIKYLEASMRKYGWIDAYPMHVMRNGNKLRIKAGHHRFYVAKKIGIPVKYVVCGDDISIQELEQATVPWSMKDYLTSFIRCGKQAYLVVQEYHERTGIGLSSCIALLAGQSAGTNNKREDFKSGTYSIKDNSHAGIVADIVLHCKKCEIAWATHNLFVQAVSRIMWVKKCDANLLKQKIHTYPYLLEKQPSLVDYVDMLETVFNRRSRNRIPLAFLADEEAKKRREKLFASK